MGDLTNRRDKNIEKRATIFRIVLDKISFQHDGYFSLKLTIGGSNISSKQGLRLRAGNNKTFLNDYTIKTEVLGPVTKGAFQTFNLKEYDFYLPKGYCKNDIDHEVYLLIEALQINKDARSKAIGDVKLPIYPRGDVNTNYDKEIGEPFYSIKDSIRIIKLDRTSSELHCGDLFYSAEFSEIYEIFEQEHLTPIPSPEPIPIKKKSPLIDISGSTPMVDEKKREDKKPVIKSKLIDIGSDYFNDLPKEINIVEEKIPQPRDSHIKEERYTTLAPNNHEEISVLVHGAENVYSQDGSLTFSYVVSLQRTGAPLSETPYDATHSTKYATSHPYWGQILTIRNVAGKLQKFLSLLLVDNTNKMVICEFLLPTKSLVPFLHHHFKLSQEFNTDNERVQNPIQLSITVIKKLDHYIPKQIGMDFSALVIKPLALRYSQQFPHQNHTKLVCMAYISNNLQKNRFSKPNIEEQFQELIMPIDIDYEYIQSTSTSQWSQVQLSIDSYGTISSSEEGVGGHKLIHEIYWGFPFSFSQTSEIDTAFSINSCVFIDFYRIENTDVQNSLPWQFVSTDTSIVIPLDKSLFDRLNTSTTPPLPIITKTNNTIVAQSPYKYPSYSSSPSKTPVTTSQSNKVVFNKYKVQFPQIMKRDDLATTKYDMLSVMIKLAADKNMDQLNLERATSGSSYHRKTPNRYTSEPIDFLYKIEPGLSQTVTRPYMYIEKNSKKPLQKYHTYNSHTHPKNKNDRRYSNYDTDEDYGELMDRLKRMDEEMRQIKNETKTLEQFYSTKNDRHNSPNKRSPHHNKNSKPETQEYMDALEKAVKDKELWIRHLEKKLKLPR